MLRRGDTVIHRPDFKMDKSLWPIQPDTRKTLTEWLDFNSHKLDFQHDLDAMEKSARWSEPHTDEYGIKAWDVYITFLVI